MAHVEGAIHRGWGGLFGISRVNTTPTLESLFKNHVNDVVRMVSRLLGPGASQADVDDLVQQVFLTIHKALPRFRGDSAVTTWIYGICTRVVLAHLRNRRRYRLLIDQFEESCQVAPTTAALDETVARRESLRKVWGALLRMKPERRIVFVLIEIEEMSAPEAAAVLNLSEEAVRSRLRRARRDLESRLKALQQKEAV